MPGIFYMTGRKGSCSSLSEDKIKGLVRLEDAVVQVIYDDGFFFACSHAAEGYPVESWEKGDYLFCVDGMIYNLAPDGIRERLIGIAKSLGSHPDLRSHVSTFVREADGDFTICVYDPREQRSVIFNDCQARLASYRMESDGVFYFSRDIKLLLHYASKLSFDKNAMLESITLRYPLGAKTLFREIKRLAPGEAVFIDRENEAASIVSFFSAPIEFSLEEPFDWDGERTLEALKGEYLRGLMSRIATARNKGYRITADLSGGFDTRVLLAGLSAIGERASFHSIKLATGDESGIAQRIFEAAGSPGTFSILEPSHEYTVEDIDEAVYKNDGMINYYTVMVSEKDIESLKRNNPDKVVRFCGLGGEFMRHPIKHLIGSLGFGFLHGAYSPVSVKASCQVVKAEYRKYKQYLKKYISSYPEGTRDGILKHWYYEYYGNYVSGTAEDRERSMLWTIHPLWASGLTRQIYKHVPLNRVGYEFFCRFLEKLSPKMLEVQVYGAKSDISSRRAAQIFDRKNDIAKFMVALAKVFLPAAIVNFLKTIVAPRPVEAVHEVERAFDYAIKDNPLANKLLDLNKAKKYVRSVHTIEMARQLITLIIYLREVNRRFDSKIVIECE